jgi:hypothetical protein
MNVRQISVTIEMFISRSKCFLPNLTFTVLTEVTGIPMSVADAESSEPKIKIYLLGMEAGLGWSADRSRSSRQNLKFTHVAATPMLVGGLSRSADRSCVSR